jgi:hypothetical protein
MKKLLTRGSVVSLLALVFGASLLPAIASAQTANWQVPMKAGVAYPTATGSAQYQAQPGQRELQVEVYKITSLAGKSLLVQVNGANFGWMKVSATGVAKIDHNTELGQAVPVVTHGTTIIVKTAAGVIVASGTF